MHNDSPFRILVVHARPKVKSVTFVISLFCSSCILAQQDGNTARPNDAISSRQLKGLISQLEANQKTYKETLVGNDYISKDSRGRIIGIALYGDQVTDDNIRLVSTIPSLRRFEVACPEMDAPFNYKSLLSLTELKNLEELILLGAVRHVNTDMAGVLCRLKSVTTLETDYCTIDPQAFALIMKMPGLKKLIVNLSSGATDEEKQDSNKLLKE